MKIIKKKDLDALKYLLNAAAAFLHNAKHFSERGYPPPNHWIGYAKENVEEIQLILGLKRNDNNR